MTAHFEKKYKDSVAHGVVGGGPHRPECDSSHHLGAREPPAISGFDL